MTAAIQKHRQIEGDMEKRFLRATAGTPQADDNGRIIRYVFSDDSVARDGHIINTAGWDLTDFLSNPVFLWAHDDTQPPIGRVAEIGVVGNKLMGNVEYADPDVYPFADTVYRLVKGGFLNAVSVCWGPIEYRFTQDKNRPGGIDFIRQELWEVSQVPVPALPSALVTARKAGIDTGPMHEWLERALDTGGLAMVPRAELEELRRAAKMPAIGKPKSRVKPPAKKRGLYDVCELAYLVNSLGYLQASSAREENFEGDDSTVPSQLLAALKALGAALVAMTQEEVAELLTGLGADDLPDLIDDEALEVYLAAAKTPGQRALRQIEAVLRRKRAPSQSANIRQIEQFIRAGRVLSKANEETLRAAHGAISDACDSIMAVCDAASGGEDEEDDPPPGPAPDATAERARRARARAAKALSLVDE